MNRMLLLIFSVFVLSGCAPSTEITGSWKNPQVSQKKVNGINSILITSLTDKTNVRQTVENDLTNALQKEDVKAIKSIDILPPSFTEEKNQIRRCYLIRSKEQMSMPF